VRALSVEISYRDTARRFLAVDPDGTAYATALGENGTVYASRDGRAWELRSARSDGAPFMVATALSSGVLLADTVQGSGNVIVRSADGGRTWQDVLPLGRFRILTPHHVAELAGEVFLLEYQSFTGDNTPIHLWVSQDEGLTWSVRALFLDHRHGHGLLADPASGALWLFFGDRTGATYFSMDQGRTLTFVRTALDGGCFVDAVATPTGILGGMDTLFQPLYPMVVRLGRDGSYQQLAALPGPSYSFHRLSGGGYLVGAAREAAGDVYPDDSAHVLASTDGLTYAEVLAFPSLGGGDPARADVYWELSTGEPVLELRNAEGFSDAGGFAILRVK
jgi:hypothetical protein